MFLATAALCKQPKDDWAARLSNSQLVTLANERVAEGRVAATCGRHDEQALDELRRLERQLAHFDFYATKIDIVKGAGRPDDICIPEGRPDGAIQTVKNVLQELRERAKKAGVK